MTIPENDVVRCKISVNFRDTEVSVSRGAEVLWSNRFRSGGVDWVIALMNYFRFTHHLLIGRFSAERILVDLGAAEKLESPIIKEVRGRNLDTGLPNSIEVSSNQLCEAIGVKGQVGEITSIVTGPERSENGTLYSPTRIPSELRVTLANQPVILSGEFGGLRGLDHVLQDALNVSVVTMTDNTA